MEILERIEEHERLAKKLKENREVQENILDRINEKINYHNKAICNLIIKNDKIEYDRSRNPSTK